MALVDYSSESEEDHDPSQNVDASATTLKRKRDDIISDLPPLPSKFHDLYASTVRVSTRDDPSLHGGRKRVTPHIEGNWPTHLYIEWYPSATEHAALSSLISSLQAEISPGDNIRGIIHTFLTSDLGAPLPLHISLSRSVGLVTEQKDGFLTSLERAVKSSSIRPFEVVISGLDWVPNFEKTRWFLVLRLGKPTSNGLNKLLHISNSTAEEYGQPPLYTKRTTTSEKKRKLDPFNKKRNQNPEPIVIQDALDAFHISIAWTLEPPSQELIKSTKLKINEETFSKVKDIGIKVEEIKAKLGNVVTNIPLPNKVLEGNGLFGV